MPLIEKSSVPLTGIERVAATYARSSLSPGFDAALKASRAWSNTGAVASFKAVEDAANKVTLAGAMRPEAQQSFERWLPSATLAGGLDSASFAAAQRAAVGTQIVGLNSQAIDVARELMSSATIAGRLRSEAPKMAEGWLSRMAINNLYSAAEAARLAGRFTFLGGSAAQLVETYSLGRPIASHALAEIIDRQSGLLPAFSQRQAQRIAEQHLALMPSWSVAEMVKMKVGVNDLARLGVLRPRREPAATLRELSLRGVGARSFDFNLALPAGVPSRGSPMRRLAGAVTAPAPARPKEIEPAPQPPAGRPQRQPQENNEVAPAAADFLARRRRQMVVALFEHAELFAELEQLEAIEERLRKGSKPARIHAAVSTRWVLKGVADRFYPARGQRYVCRFNCPHKVGAEEIANRISAFVDERLSSIVDTHTQKQFQSTLDWVYRWGGRGTHEHCRPVEAIQGYLWLLEVLAMVARAYEVQHRVHLTA